MQLGRVIENMFFILSGYYVTFNFWSFIHISTWVTTIKKKIDSSANELQDFNLSKYIYIYIYIYKLFPNMVFLLLDYPTYIYAVYAVYINIYRYRVYVYIKYTQYIVYILCIVFFPTTTTTTPVLHPVEILGQHFQLLI